MKDSTCSQFKDLLNPRGIQNFTKYIFHLVTASVNGCLQAVSVIKHGITCKIPVEVSLFIPEKEIQDLIKIILQKYKESKDK